MRSYELNSDEGASVVGRQLRPFEPPNEYNSAEGKLALDVALLRGRVGCRQYIRSRKTQRYSYMDRDRRKGLREELKLYFRDSN